LHEPSPGNVFIVHGKLEPNDASWQY